MSAARFPAPADRAERGAGVPRMRTRHVRAHPLDWWNARKTAPVPRWYRPSCAGPGQRLDQMSRKGSVEASRPAHPPTAGRGYPQAIPMSPEHTNLNGSDD
jgi:hypothetical protein